MSPAEAGEQAAANARHALPYIRLEPGEEAAAGLKAQQALLSREVPLFRYAGRLVEIGTAKMRGVRCEETTATVLEPVNADALLSIYSEHIQFEKWNERKKAWTRTNCPRPVADQFLARPTLWEIRTLTGVSTIPVLRPDGTLLDTPGYDAQTGMFYKPDPGATIPPIDESPTKAVAERELATIEGELLSGFPFTSPADKAVALSFVLSSCARRCFPHAPMHVFSAPKAGTGKGKLVNIASMIAEGHAAAATDFTPDTEELRKNLEASLMHGGATFNLDNVDAPLGGHRLCSLITEDTARARILGQSRVVEVSCSTLFSANGNNVVLQGDMQRRAIMCYIDAACERPEERPFNFDPTQRARENRGRYVAAAITILRAYIVAGMPVRVSPFGSFDEWSRLIRGALIWLGCEDPYLTAQNIKVEEPEGNALGAVLTALKATIGAGKPITVRELIDTATGASRPGFPPLGGPSTTERLKDALVAVSGNSHGGIDARALGNWLGSIKKQVRNGLRIDEATMRDGSRRWQLEERESEGAIEELLS